MSKGKFVAALVVAVAVGAGTYIYVTRGAGELWTAASRLWNPEKATAQQPPAARVVPVEVVTATIREVPVRLEALGTVTPMASVAIKARLELSATAPR
jgi:multidrug efflux system membrane fusion protein